VRQLSLVLVKVPLEDMYWPALLMIATSTRCMAWSSSARPLTKMRPSVNFVPSVGASRPSVKTGGVSPG
jgi:hypothetical protein